jgi:uncharacterized RDD family membrane protein YckC
MTFFKQILINSYTEFLYQKISGIMIPNKRINSTLIDFIFIIALFFTVGLVCMILNLSTISIFNSFLINPWTIGYMILMFLIINKDYSNSKSIGKRIIGYKVVTQKKGNSASKIQCVIRNLTLLFWPLEVILLLVYPNRRIGDFIAGTKVIPSEKVEYFETLNEFKKSRNNSRILWILISIIISVILAIVPKLIERNLN